MIKIKSIGIVLYDGFNTLDVAGPLQVFYWLQDFWDKSITIYLIGPNKNTLVKSRENVQWSCDTGYDDAPDNLDIIMVPGGGGPDFGAVLENKNDTFSKFYHLVTSRSQNAQLVTGVCVGSLLLAKAGLLNGYNCTTHWAAKHQLAQFPGVIVEAGFPRYVIDRNRVTGGGVSSGIDESLAIAEIVAGADTAQQIQLIIQYAPNPPYNSGDPSVASPSVLHFVSTHI